MSESGAGAARVGDAERQAVVDLLRRHTSEGRLTLDEFSDLVGDVYAATTRDELDTVVAKLPEGVRPPSSGGAAIGARASGPSTPASTQDAAEVARRGSLRRRFVAIMSGSHARGPWRAAPKMSAFAYWGHVYLDLRSALIESPVVEIKAWAVMGGVTITVPPGIPVELDGFVLMGGSHNAVRGHDPIPGAPLVRVRARGMWGGVLVRTPGSRSQHDHHRHGNRQRDDAMDQAWRHTDEALDRARTAVQRALPSRFMDDQVPTMPFSEHSRVASDPTGDDRPGAPPPPADRTSRAARPPAGSRVATGPSANGASPGTGSSGISGDQARSQATFDESSRVPHGTLTMLVSDIAGSTQMTERLGDQGWIEVLGAHNAVVRAQVAEHGGTEVKAQGDGFLVVFPSARAAVLAAIAIQKAIEDYCAEHPERPVQLRVGLHTGEVAVVDDDVFGQNVVVACRITEIAEPGEIVVSSLTRDLAASASDLRFDAGSDITLKGLSQPWRVHRVLWSQP